MQIANKPIKKRFNFTKSQVWITAIIRHQFSPTFKLTNIFLNDNTQMTDVLIEVVSSRKWLLSYAANSNVSWYSILQEILPIYIKYLRIV